MTRSIGFLISAIFAMLLTNGSVASADTQSANIETENMQIVFEDGWLTRWVNKVSGETVDFGRLDIDRGDRDMRHYKPGAWWVDWKTPDDLEAVKSQWKMNLEQTGPDEVTFSQAVQQAEGEVQAAQWGLRVPYDQIDAVHFPKGLSPARMAGRDTVTGYFVTKTYHFGGRKAVMGGGGAWRLRFYQVQGKTGGLLIYFADPEMQHGACLEFYDETEGELVISNRSLAEPPWKNEYNGGKWVIRQYQGYVHQGAQIYEDWLKEAYDLTYLEDRPTAWAKDLAYVFVNSTFTNPLPYPGMRRPLYNYSGDWERSMEVDRQWLDNLAQVVEPEKVMFYISNWKYVPSHDMSWPDHSIDPYFAKMVGEVRRRGFHVMLHFHNTLLHEESQFYPRYARKQDDLRGLDTEDKMIWGAGHDAIRNQEMISRDKQFGNSWSERQGYEGDGIIQSAWLMNPAYEGWRYMFVSAILSAVRATNADAVHLDVPNYWIDLHNERYGMTCQQGYRAFYKLLRETLDENGYEHVAIANEVTPHEAALPYVDFAQTSRDNSVGNLLSGKFGVPENFGNQTGEDLQKLLDLRKQAAEEAENKRFIPEYFRVFLSNMRELGEPDINSLASGRFVQGYPHLGAHMPYSGGYGAEDPNVMIHNRVHQALCIWYGFTHDTYLHSSGGHYNMFMDAKPWEDLEVLQIYRKWVRDNMGTRYTGKYHNNLDYGKFALARFWADQEPKLMAPGRMERSDIARYKLKDGRELRLTRSDPLTLRFYFDGGETLAELHLFDGWKNDERLMEKYEPVFLKNQLDRPPQE